MTVILSRRRNRSAPTASFRQGLPACASCTQTGRNPKYHGLGAMDGKSSRGLNGYPMAVMHRCREELAHNLTGMVDRSAF